MTYSECGSALYYFGDYEESINKISKCKELNYQNNGLWQFKLSLSYYIISEYENALKYIIISNQINPKGTDTLFLYFLILLKMNKNEKCKIILQKIKKINNNLYNFGLGYYNFKINKSKEKKNTEILMLKFIDCYKNNCLEDDHLYSMNISFYSNLISEYYNFISDYNNSIKYLNLSIKYNKFNPFYWFSKGKILKKQNNYYEALYCLEKAWNINNKLKLINNNYINIRDEVILFALISNFYRTVSFNIPKKRYLDDPDNFSQSDLKRRRIY